MHLKCLNAYSPKVYATHLKYKSTHQAHFDNVIIGECSFNSIVT